MLISRIFRPPSVQKTLHITDLTRMSGDKVCFAGLDEEGACFRPVLQEPLLLKHLYRGSQLVVRPRARVRLELTTRPVDPPHVEDRSFEHRSMVLEGISDNLQWEGALKKGLFNSVESIFDGCLKDRRWVLPGAPTRSLGTIAAVSVERLVLEERDSKLEYRLSFIDGAGVPYNSVAVTDLTFRRFADIQIEQEGSPLEAATKLTLLLKKMRVYLRLGLTRPWAPSGQAPVCWLQATGIHTFPDYVAGRSFADL